MRCEFPNASARVTFPYNKQAGSYGKTVISDIGPCGMRSKTLGGSDGHTDTHVDVSSDGREVGGGKPNIPFVHNFSVSAFIVKFLLSGVKLF